MYQRKPALERPQGRFLGFCDLQNGTKSRRGTGLAIMSVKAEL
jgi:hypothetical protein